MNKNLKIRIQQLKVWHGVSSHLITRSLVSGLLVVPIIGEGLPAQHGVRISPKISLVAKKTRKLDIKTFRAGGSKVGYTVMIKEVKMIIPDESYVQWWGSDGDPCFRVDKLRIFKGKSEFVVPRSAFPDLTNVGELSILKVKGGCEIHISGGDASTSYDAVISVHGEDVTKRVVRAGEFPENWFETTIYVSTAPSEN